MRDFDQILSELRKNKSDLLKRYPISKIGIFGSYARGESVESSDLDILVELSQPIGLDFVLLGDELEDILQIKVDLLSANSLKDSLKKYIDQDIVYV